MNMGWRIVVITGVCKLDLKMGYLIVRKDVEKRLYLDEISVMIIESTSVSMTGALICEMTRRKIRIILCDEKHNPYGEIMPYAGCTDASKRLKNQIAWTERNKSAVWTEIVKTKVKMQRNQLALRGLSDEANVLDRYLGEIQEGDSTNREGLSAKVYFRALFGNDFTRKNECATNACLNYGYAIILAAVNRDLTAFGCNTLLGIEHSNQFNHYNLGSDVMEPLRPLVDHFAIEINPKQFKRDERISMAGILNTHVKFNGKKWYLNDAIPLYCRSIVEALSSGDLNKIHFIEYGAPKIHEIDSVLRSTCRYVETQAGI